MLVFYIGSFSFDFVGLPNDGLVWFSYFAHYSGIILYSFALFSNYAGIMYQDLSTGMKDIATQQNFVQ